MSEIKNDLKKEVKECNCDEYKAQIAELSEQVKQLTETVSQYEKAYSEISTKYNRLYGLLGNTIEYSLGIK